MNHNARRNTVLNKNIPNIAAAFLRTFYLNTAIRIGKVAVPDMDILNAAAHFAAYADTMSKCAETVKDVDMPAGPVNQIALRIFPGFNCNRIIACEKTAGKKGTVFRRIRVPSISIPDSLRNKGAMICNDVVRVNHVNIPTCTVF